MSANSLTLQALWDDVNFKPNSSQEQAILEVNGPLFLTAGPGSGKTRVLLWRTLNLIVFYDIEPEEIFLSTFTEKAARQLQEGLRFLLGLVTNRTGKPYDISKMYVGTVHSLCQSLIADRRFSQSRQRAAAPVLLDELDQYFYLSNSKTWQTLTEAVGLDNYKINYFFSGKESASKHTALSNCINLFNRLSEEDVKPAGLKLKTDDETLKLLLLMYESYQESLISANGTTQVDFSLLQQTALKFLDNFNGSSSIFKYVIIDEYQDTNTIQEKLFFKLASDYKNICIVGDDDQALYRFRGATVENFVQFPQRCKKYLNIEPKTIDLDINYRSRRQIVNLYTNFISHSHCNWQKDGLSGGYYRIVDKKLEAHSQDTETSVIASTPNAPEQVCQEIAQLTKHLIDSQKVQDPNQIAFLFPSLKSEQVKRMKEALEAKGLQVYAPRAGRFLEVEESVALFGIYLTIFGKPERGNFSGADYNAFHDWIDNCLGFADTLLQSDPSLAEYIRECQSDIETVSEDYRLLETVAQQNGWQFNQPYDLANMKPKLLAASGLSMRAKRSLSNQYFEQLVTKRSQQGNPYALGDAINRATQLTWNILDLFWQITGFEHFRTMFDLAESGLDEGPICNLGLITQYLARFMDSYGSFLTGGFLRSQGFIKTFFWSYLYAIFRRGESEYEDADDPFPKGRIPFLTIHQAKGLEFPVVVLGNPRKDNKSPQTIEKIVRPLLDREGEPLHRQAEFDTMRMFYVALSRAKNLLVIAHFQSRGNRINEPFKSMLRQNFPRIPTFDLAGLPEAKIEEDDTARNYSYTSDYLLYQGCPRQYMIFRKYSFAASQTETLLFGSLVHQTIEDLHHYLISRRQNS